MLGIAEFPWTTVLIWAFVGLMAALVIAAAFWGKTQGGLAVYLRFAFYGVLDHPFVWLRAGSMK